jgi:uncharacterized membrane protein YgcG
VSELIQGPSSFATRQLDARDYSVDPASTGSPVVLVTTPGYAMADVRGYVMGPAGAYAMFAMSQLAFQDPMPAVGFPDSVLVVPTGQHFRFVVNRDQNVWGLGSVSPRVAWGRSGLAVYVSYSVTFIELQMNRKVQVEESAAGGHGDGGGNGSGGGSGGSGGSGGGSGGGGGIVGPGVGWRKA